MKDELEIWTVQRLAFRASAFFSSLAVSLPSDRKPPCGIPPHTSPALAR